VPVASGASCCRLVPEQSGVYRLEGPLTLETVPALRPQGIEALEASPAGLTLELSQLPRIDSAGLALLIDWLAVARACGRTLRLSRPPETLLALARLSEVETLIMGEAGSGV
jgi:phospholipid transport system transporter-binding protein